MKIAAVIMLIACLQVHAGGFAQKISLNEKDVTLSTLLKKVKAQSGYDIFYDANLLRDAKRLSVSVRDVPLEQFLEECLKGLAIDYAIVGRIIVLTQKEEGRKPLTDVAGRVTDPSGTPLEGIVVTQKGSSNATYTNSKGEFVLKNVDENATLEFSGVNVESQQVGLNGRTNIFVSLRLRIEDLGAVTIVPIGYGEARKTTFTGAVSAISGKELQQVPAANLSQSLAGRLPGLIARNTSGQPGADGATLLIRGLGTTGDNSPLIVIDGIPRPSIDRLLPEDIETVSILKDASSVAVFGARAANGVILITTKRGKKSGKPSITYTADYGLQYAIQQIKPADSYTMALSWNDAWKNEGSFDPTYTGLRGFNDEALQAIKNGTDPNRFANNNWYKAVVDNYAPQTRHNISVSGGTEKIRYYTSFSYLDQHGLYPASKYKNYSLRANIDAEVAPNLDLALQIAGWVGATKNSYTSPIRNANFAPTLLPIQYTNGTYGYIEGWLTNPVLDSKGVGGYRNTTENVLQNTLSLTWRLPWIRGLSAKGLVAFDKTFNVSKAFQKPYTGYILNDDNSYTALYSPRTNVASINETFNQNQYLTAEASLNYDNNFGKHGIKALLLYTQTQYKANSIGATRNTFASTLIDEINLGSQTTANNSGTSSQNARRGLVGRLGYDYSGKYLFDFTFRYDGSDVFPPEHRFGFFPAFAAGWRLSEESFLAPYKFIDNLKLRASWGAAGKDAAGAFQYLNTYSLTNAGYPMGGVAGQALIPGVIANPSFSWEKAYLTDIGLEATLWKGLLGFEVDWFYKRTKNILASRSFEIPAVIGGSLPSENTATVDNKGIDLVLSHNNYIGKVNYTIRASFTYTTSKVIYFPEAAGAADYAKKTGKAVQLGATTGYLADGLYQSQDEIDKGPTTLYPNTKPGDIKYVDVDGDGAITAADQVLISRGPTPGIVYGLNLGAGYKGFTLNVFLQGAADADLLIDWDIQRPFHAGDFRLLQFQTDYWTPENRGAEFPAISVTRAHNWATSSFWKRSGDYLRVKNVELVYTLPHTITGRVFSGPVSIAISGTNLLTFSKIKHIVDPEFGVSSAAYPVIKLVNARLRITL